MQICQNVFLSQDHITAFWRVLHNQLSEGPTLTPEFVSSLFPQLVQTPVPDSPARSPADNSSSSCNGSIVGSNDDILATNEDSLQDGIAEYLVGIHFEDIFMMKRPTTYSSLEQIVAQAVKEYEEKSCFRIAIERSAADARMYFSDHMTADVSG